MRGDGWSSSKRGNSLPKNWWKIRGYILKRDGNRCCATTEFDERCGRKATDVHHINSAFDHSEFNLISLCSFHHKIETHRESIDAQKPRRTKRRPPPVHPFDKLYGGKNG